MRFNIDPKIFQQHHDLKIGVILIKGMNNARRVSAVESLLRGICAQRSVQFKEADLHEEPMVKVWEQAYGLFGVNPKKFQPSIAALLKRVKSGKEIPHVNLLVDIYNYFSLKYLLPIGGEDLDWLCGDLNLTYTEGGEPFRPLGTIDVEQVAEGEIAYKDKGGITCRYWNHRECERSKFTSKTVNAALFIEDLSKMHLDQFGKIIEEIAQAASKYIGGHIQTAILNEETSSIDLGVEGRRTADDSKITQQEKAYYLEKATVETPKKKPAKSAKKVSIKGSTKAKKTSRKKKIEQLALIEEERSLKLDSNEFIKERLKDLISIAVTKTFPQITYPKIELNTPAKAEHGDYACNIALKLGHEFERDPKSIAEKIIANISDLSLVEKMEIAGPGFINFFLSQNFLLEELKKILKEKVNYGASKIGSNKTILLDYSSPNIAKPLGVHHLLSTIIGQTLYNIFAKLNFNCVSINHIGDWGTQFGKLICAYKKWGNKEEIEAAPIDGLLKLYVKFHDEAEKNPALEDEAREEFNKFEKGDKENYELWKWFVRESLKDMDKTYHRLGGIKFDRVQGESFYEDKLADILQEGKTRGIFVKGEEDAYVVQFDEEDVPPFVVQKKDGATLYSTRDFAALKYRIREWQPLKILYVVDIAQTLHFKQLFKAAQRFPWYHGEGEHVWFGRMHMQDGQMSTRKGNVVLLDSVIDEAIERSLKIIEEKNPNLKNKEDVARMIGIGGIKYNILSQNRTTDITFDWDKMLSMEGNSAPYLQYTYARAKSLLRKSKEENRSIEKEEKLVDPSDAQEKIQALIRVFPKFAEQIAFSAQEYKPNILANYLYELAQKFNSFYNSVPVIKAEKAEDKDFRLKLAKAASYILLNGLEILGIEAPEEM